MMTLVENKQEAKMPFVIPSDIESNVDFNKVALEVNMLLSGQLKIQTLHNHSVAALRDKDVSTYLEKSIAKTYYKYLTKTGETK